MRFAALQVVLHLQQRSKNDRAEEEWKLLQHFSLMPVKYIIGRECESEDRVLLHLHEPYKSVTMAPGWAVYTRAVLYARLWYVACKI